MFVRGIYFGVEGAALWLRAMNTLMWSTSLRHSQIELDIPPWRTDYCYPQSEIRIGQGGHCCSPFQRVPELQGVLWILLAIMTFISWLLIFIEGPVWVSSLVVSSLKWVVWIPLTAVSVKRSGNIWRTPFLGGHTHWLTTDWTSLSAPTACYTLPSSIYLIGALMALHWEMRVSYLSEGITNFTW